MNAGGPEYWAGTVVEELQVLLFIYVPEAAEKQTDRRQEEMSYQSRTRRLPIKLDTNMDYQLQHCIGCDHLRLSAASSVSEDIGKANYYFSDKIGMLLIQANCDEHRFIFKDRQTFKVEKSCFKPIGGDDDRE